MKKPANCSFIPSPENDPDIMEVCKTAVAMARAASVPSLRMPVAYANPDIDPVRYRDLCRAANEAAVALRSDGRKVRFVRKLFQYRDKLTAYEQTVTYCGPTEELVDDAFFLDQPDFVILPVTQQVSSDIARRTDRQRVICGVEGQNFRIATNRGEIQMQIEL